MALALLYLLIKSKVQLFVAEADMVAGSRGRFTYLLVLVTFLFSFLVEDEAQARRRGRGFRRGGAARVSARRRPVNRGRVVVNNDLGLGRGARIVAQNNGVLNVDGVAVDETGLAGFAFADRNNIGGVQQIVLNGQNLAVGRDRFGRLVALPDNSLDVNGVLIDNNQVAAVPLIQLRGGQVISGFDARGRSLSSRQIRDLQFLNNGGLQ